MNFFDRVTQALDSRYLPADLLKKVEYDNAKVVASILEFASGDTDGQLRNDCKLRRFNLASFRLGSLDSSLSEDERKEIKDSSARNIHLNAQGEQYAIIGKFYIDLMAEVLPTSNDFVWFLPSLTYTKWLSYEGSPRAILACLEDCWQDIYEFYIVAKDFSWLVHKDHFHNIFFLGDTLAQATATRRDHPTWKNRILNHSFHLSYTNGHAKK